MKSTGMPKKVKSKKMFKGLRNIDKLFEELDQNSSLPGFGEFFMTCLVMGNAECVNLRLLYPKLYEKLTAWIAEHNKNILQDHK